MMQTFDLRLPGGNTLAGRIYVPVQPSKSQKYLPLIICVHGGSYDADYFDADPQHSVKFASQALHVPVISISRPSYGGSTPLPAITDGRSWGEQQGQYLNTTILPEVWREFGARSGATGVVLLAHSIGAMVATVAAGCHLGTEGYPLAGLITSGIGVEHVEQSRTEMIKLLSGQPESILFDSQPKDALMLQIPHKHLVDPSVCMHTERLNKLVPTAELHDINTIWLGHWKKYSTEIRVPLMYGIGEFDGLWVSTEDAVERYKSAFPNCPRIECGIIPMAPHCIELSLQGKGWLYRCFGFAYECAISQGLMSETEQ
jgi:pimeloyl-ACP methyl ester carboxylesterase